MVARRLISLAGLLVAVNFQAVAADDISLASSTRSLGNGRWQWTAFLKADSTVLRQVVCVQYILGLTFPNPTRLVCEKGLDAQPFGLTDTAWDDFSLSATVIFNDSRTENRALLVKLPGKPERAGNTLQLRALDRTGSPISNVSVLLVSPDGRYVSGQSGQDGRVALEFFDSARPTVFCAGPGFSGSLKADVDPSRPVVCELTASPGGSIIVENGTGFISGLEGRLNPILDSQERSYIYADNIAIEGGKSQPYAFRLGQPFRVEDVKGRTFSLTVLAMRGRSFLISYIPVR